MHRGTVEAFDRRKKVGRILQDADKRAVSVDIKAVDRAGISSIHPGQRIEYELEYDHFGRGHAIDIRLIHVRTPLGA